GRGGAVPTTTSGNVREDHDRATADHLRGRSRRRTAGPVVLAAAGPLPGPRTTHQAPEDEDVGGRRGRRRIGTALGGGCRRGVVRRLVLRRSCLPPHDGVGRGRFRGDRVRPDDI